ncbi:hypothetical protein [Nostoc sp.]|uniref:hypothetical protein n=1 Tax=Nostoc sp. TaxID=1180 RepID=UPI002FF77123
MPKFYLHRTGKIPTAIHPFVKQTTLPEDKHKPNLLQGKIIQDVQNIVMSVYKKIYIALALLSSLREATPTRRCTNAVGIADRGRLRHRLSDLGRAAMSKPLDRLK